MPSESPVAGLLSIELLKFVSIPLQRLCSSRDAGTTDLWICPFSPFPSAAAFFTLQCLTYLVSQVLVGARVHTMSDRFHSAFSQIDLAVLATSGLLLSFCITLV